MKGYSAGELEDALGKLWELVVDRLTDAEREKLGIDTTNSQLSASSIFEELDSFGPCGPVGLGLGRMGGHAIGEEE